MRDQLSVDRLIPRWILSVLAITALLLGGIVVFAILVVPSEDSARLEHWKLCLSALQFVLGSFLVACLGILIPTGLTETRYRFGRLRESRTAFSQAKTGVDYLALRLCALSLKEAGQVLQESHVWKHTAELYSELEIHLRNRGETITPSQWANLLYEQLHSVRDVLQENAASWDVMPPNERLEKLKSAQATGVQKWEGYTGLKRSDLYVP